MAASSMDPQGHVGLCWLLHTLITHLAWKEYLDHDLGQIFCIFSWYTVAPLQGHMWALDDTLTCQTLLWVSPLRMGRSVEKVC